MVLRRGPHQRGLPVPILPRIHVGAVREQHLRRLDAAGAGGGHQRRLAFGAGRVRIGAGLQKLFDHRRVAVDAGQIERRDAVAIRRFDVGAGAKQAVGEVRVVLTDGPVQRRRAVGFRSVDVERCCSKCLDGGLVAGLDGFARPRIGAST